MRTGRRTSERTVAFLQNIAPEGVKVLPVQGITWLHATVEAGDAIIVINPCKTDYIFVPEAAWVECQEQFKAELLDGWKLCAKDGETTAALQSMAGSVIGLYEAKTDAGVKGGLPSVRAQALLEYMAINQMRYWPADDVIVLFGDLNKHYVVHAGREDAGKAKRSLHVAGPAPTLPSVAEHAPAAADHSSCVTLGFIRALLSTRRTEEAGSRGVVTSGTSGGGGSGSGGGSGGGGESGNGGGSGSGGGGSGASGRGGRKGAGGRWEEASGRGGGARGSGDEEAGCGSNDSGAGAASSGRGGSFGSGADSSDGDEGLAAAARENANAQTCLSFLQLPEVYEPLGFKQPPTSFRPLTSEEYLARFQPV